MEEEQKDNESEIKVEDSSAREEKVEVKEKNKELSKDKSKNNRSKVGLIITVVVTCIVGLMVLIIILINSAASGPQKVSDQLINDIKSKNGSSVYSLLSPSAKTTVTEQQLQEIVNRVGPILTGNPKVENKEVSASTDNGSTAKIVYSIKGTDGIYTFTVNMVVENDEWKILNFDSQLKK
jgi:cytoskeletal protein RodZ